MSEGPILLVEDNSDDAVLICLELEKKSGQRRVIWAKSGENALKYLFDENKLPDSDHSDLPSMVILDLDLGSMNGEQVLRRIRGEHNTHHIPVVIFTSAERKSQMESLYESGANSYVKKPGGYIDFKNAVNRIADYWLETNRTALRE